MLKKYIFLLSAKTSLLLVLFASLFPSAGGSTAAEKKINVLIITIDTMRADHIGAYGSGEAKTPNLDRLAGRGVLFENSYSSVPLTLPSHCSLFTGKYPISHNVKNNGSYVLDAEEITLAEKMKEYGFQTYAVVASFVLLSKFGLNQGFDVYDDALNLDEMIRNFDSEIKADLVFSKFSRWIKARDKNKEFFAWIHFYDPHTPYNPPDEYRKKFSDNLEGLYNGEVAYTDFYIGKVIEELESENQLANTLVIITGDHGEAFGEHQEFGHSIFCYEENLKVPLIFFNSVLLPKSRRITTRVNLIDIMPTIFELLNLKIQNEFQGKSLMGLLSGQPEKKERVFYVESLYGKEDFGWAPLVGIIKDSFKYISLPEPELYNLELDKGEKNNLFPKKIKQAEDLDEALKKFIAEYGTPEESSRRALNADDLKRLKSLGYVSAFSERVDSNIDPKEGIVLLNTLNEVELNLDGGDLVNLLIRLEEEAGKNPDLKIPPFYEVLSKIYKKMGDQDKIIANWTEAIKNYPENDHLKINLAFEFFNVDKLEDAEKLGLEILGSNANYSRTHILLAKIHEKRGQNAEAAKYYESALKLEPNNVSLKIGYGRLLAEIPSFNEAFTICQELLENDSVKDDMRSLSRIGILLAQINKDEMAMEILNRIVSAGEADAEALNYLGILHFRRGNFQKSLESYKRSLEKDPSQAATYNNLGALYLSHFIQTKEGQFHSQAVSFFNKALEIDPDLASALNGRGSAYKFLNRIQEALEDWKRAIELKSDYVDVYFNLAVTYIQLEQKPDALKLLSTLKEKYYTRLVSQDQERLERLLGEVKNKK